MTGNNYPRWHSGPTFLSTTLLRSIPRAVLEPDWYPFPEEQDTQGKFRATLRIEWTGTEEEFEQYRRERSAA